MALAMRVVRLSYRFKRTVPPSPIYADLFNDEGDGYR
jgi:hypothetical protein